MESKPARGRKRKLPIAVENVQLVVEELEPAETEDAKKRGRKPKGGKIVTRVLDEPIASTSVHNVILHLKCTVAELDEYHQSKHSLPDPMQYNPAVPPEIVSFQQDIVHFSAFDGAPKDTPVLVGESPSSVVNGGVSPEQALKVKKLKIRLYHKSHVDVQKSACFWCTYEFDNEAFYIPKSVEDTEVHAYGSFCRPQCAVAYLMAENMDDSTKFERYHLLNRMYGGKHNIKPAPNPHYLLEKYYGNQTIEEYRQLLGSDHLLYTLDKPLTRILPELHEVTDDFILGIYGRSGTNAATQAGGVYKVKRQSEKLQGPSKASIIRGKFGMTQ